MAEGPRLHVPLHRRTTVVALLVAAAGAGLRCWLPDRAREATGSPAANVTRSGTMQSPGQRVDIPTRESLCAQSALHRLKSLAAALPHMTVKDIAPIVATLAPYCQNDGDGPLDPAGNAVMRALCLRWAELDGPGMTTELAGASYRYARNVRQFAVSAWAELRGAAAVEAAAKRWPALASRAAWEIVWRHPERMASVLPWLGGEKDWWVPDSKPDALLHLLGPERFLQLSLSKGNFYGAQRAVTELCKSNAAGALYAAKSLPPGRGRDATLRQILSEMCDHPESFAAAGIHFRTEYEALPSGSLLHTEVAHLYAKALADENPDTALAWARSLTSGAARSRALYAVAEKLFDHQAPAEAALLWAEVFVEGDFTAETRPLTDSFQQWYNTAPADAETWLRSQTNQELRARLAPTLLAAGKDAWELLPAEERLHLATQILAEESATGSEGDESSQLTAEMIPAEWQHAVKLNLTRATGVGDLEWSDASTEDRRVLSEAALQVLARESPEEALKFFSEMTPGERSLGAWHEAGKIMVRQDVESAARWMESLPHGAERDAAATALVEFLTHDEALAASDRFVAPDPFALPDKTGNPDGAAAFAWAASLTGEEERRRLLMKAVQVWAKSDAGAAREAVRASALPEPDKQSLLL